MSHKTEIIDAFHRNGDRMTLGQLLDDGRYSFAHKLTARFSDLRAEGYTINCVEGKTPSENLYILSYDQPIPTPTQLKATPLNLPGCEMGAWE